MLSPHSHPRLVPQCIFMPFSPLPFTYKEIKGIQESSPNFPGVKAETLHVCEMGKGCTLVTTDHVNTGCRIVGLFDRGLLCEAVLFPALTQEGQQDRVSLKVPGSGIRGGSHGPKDLSLQADTAMLLFASPTTHPA